MAIRAKFKVESVTKGVGSTWEDVTLRPVFSADPNSENKQFWDATPSGELRMSISNPRAQGVFATGQEYYVDFIPANTAEISGDWSTPSP